MPSVNLGEQHHTTLLKAWLRAGKTVELRERQQVIGRIVRPRCKRLPSIGLTFQAVGIRFSGSELCRERTF